jgi:protein-S-isoprenylcysteine O-methyltransferase Ste14
MPWWIGYIALLLVLFVRFQPAGGAPPPPLRAEPDEPLVLVKAHHAMFYALLLGTPVEALVLGGAARGRALGLLCFAAGVALYRVAAHALGDSLSPLISPRPGATLVTDGPYRYLRHPMYVGQALIAVGAPLTLGARWTLWLGAAASTLLAIRAGLEDAALARAFPEHAAWAARAKWLVPFVF